MRTSVTAAAILPYSEGKNDIFGIYDIMLFFRWRRLKEICYNPLVICDNTVSKEDPMRRIKSLIALFLAALFVLAALPALSEENAERGINTGVTVDADPAGGYAGDYVVIYNASTDMSAAASTGSLSGRIKTDLSASVSPSRTEAGESDIPYVIDVDYEVSQHTPEKAPEKAPARENFVVGSTHTFGLYNYPPVSGSDYDFTFKLLYQGSHCNIWTPTNADYHPLDGINSDYARIAAERFDEKFELMQAAYGDFNDVNNDGRVNLLFYDIGDGWQPGQGYVAGYFWSEDFRYNNLAMIHIDTYPGIAYTNAAGNYIDHFDDCFGTLVHEFQHCINYSVTGGMNVWLNEALSGSAEELCFPGSGLYERIPSWVDHKFTSLADINNPAVEYEYNPDLDLHKGGSITAWDSSALDIFARYAEVMLFTQYLYTNFGSGVFKSIISANSGDSVEASINAVVSAAGRSWEDIWRGFTTAMIANDPASGYGFEMNAGYDPSAYYDLDSLYRLLSPVVYTSTEAAEIYGGGFITVKPVNGVFVPPTDASSSLKYVGITIGEVGLNGIGLTPASSEILLDETLDLVVVRDPIEANNYEMVWESSDTSVVTVSGNRFSAAAVPVGPGTAVITARATDKDTGAVYTATASVTVLNGHHYTKYVPVTSIETGVEYMIGAASGSDVYVVMSYNPNYQSAVGVNANYVSLSSTYYSYGIKAVLDADGAITGLDTSVYADAVPKHAEWLFYTEGDYYVIRSAYNRNYHLRVSAWDNSYDLYPQDGTSYATGWIWDGSSSQLKYEYSKGTRYITYVPSVTGYAGTFTNLFNAPKAAASVQLYKKTSGVVIDDDTTYYTVTFRDWDGTVLSSQRVAEGQSAAAPADPTREGYTFTGWSADFTNVTSDLTVTAQYTINSYTLSINYVKAEGGTAASAYTQTYEYGASYSVTSPTVEGYTPDQAVVTGTMGAGNVTITVTYTKNAPAGLLGDVNCDGVVDMKDVTALNAYLVNSGELSAEGLANADVSGDGNIDAYDSTLIAMIALGIELPN